LEELLLYQPARVTMHTRSHLILQDLELLKKFGETLEVGVSLTTDDDDVRREFEPQAPSIKRRLNLVRALHEAGIDVYVSMSPLLPCNPERLAQLVAPYADRVWVDNMRWTEVNTSPELIEKYSAHFEPDNHAQVTARLKTQFFKERSELALASQEQDDSDDAHEHELEPQTKTDRPPARASKARSRARMSSKRTRQGSAQMNTPANRPSQTQQLRLFDLR
jgi:DNA repair photolyase